MTTRWILTAAFVAAAMTGIDAQEKPVPATAPASAPQARLQTGLRVQIVLARYQGEKKISNLPYVLGVVSNGTKTSLRVGTQLPIATTMSGAGNQPSMSYSYKDLGTNIDCQAQDSTGGMYNLAITISDSSVQLESLEGSATKKATVSDVPAFRAFNATFSMLLRDGQTMQYASATDSVSGEVVKIDVTLNVLK